MEKFKRIFKELFLLQEITKECCEEIKVILLQKGNLNKTDGDRPTFFSTFPFPLQSTVELKEVEQYLQVPKQFQFTVVELSKIGGTTPYDFVKRCLSLLLTNRVVQEYSWYGAKKKKSLESYILQRCIASTQLCKAAINQKEVEEAVKVWLRRAKERAAKEDK